MKEIVTKSGVVAELNGKFCGIQYDDGHSISYEFDSISEAIISDPKYCKSPEHMTYERSHYVRKLRKAKLRRVTKTTTYEVQGV